VREGVKMRRCEDEKMRYRPPLLEEPCAQTLSGKRQKAASDFWQMVNMCQILVPEIGPSHPNRTIEKVVPSPPATALGSEGPQCAFSADQAVLS